MKRKLHSLLILVISFVTVFSCFPLNVNANSNVPLTNEQIIEQARLIGIDLSNAIFVEPGEEVYIEIPKVYFNQITDSGYIGIAPAADLFLGTITVQISGNFTSNTSFHLKAKSLNLINTVNLFIDGTFITSTGHVAVGQRTLKLDKFLQTSDMYFNSSIGQVAEQAIFNVLMTAEGATSSAWNTCVFKR